MRITNHHNLPAALYEAICHDSYSKQGDYSASELPGPPQASVLKKRHYAEIVKDASDFLWILQGRSIHELLAKHDTAGALKEESLCVTLGGVKVSGTTDLYSGDVADWKVTSVYSFLIGGTKPEWIAQLNTYAYLWERHGFAVNNLYIHAILRDWSRSKALEKDYPKIPFQTLSVPKWGMVKTEAYLLERIKLFTAANALPDDALPKCTLVEQWARPTVYAVKKEGRKSAVKNGLYNNLEPAEAHAAQVGGYVEHRPGKKVRCLDYCDARPFCWQYREEHPKETAEEFGFEVEEVG